MNAPAAPPPPDRVAEAYLGGMGEAMMQATRARIHWICGQVRGARVLDIGCSQGITAILLARAGHAVTALDPDPRVLADARGHLAAEPPEVQARLSFLEMEAGALPLSRPFDSVILGEVLEHLEDPGAMLATAAAQAAPGGRLVLTVPFGVNPFPDHRQTFYFAGPYRLISEHFDVERVEMLGRWIGFAATRPAVAPARRPPALDLVASVLPPVEAEFLAIERRLRGETFRLRRQLRALQAAQETEAAAAAQAGTQIAALHARLAAQGRALAAAEAAAASAAAELAAVRASPTHRLGATLIAAARSPRAALGLPLALARLWRASRRARQGAVAARALDLEAEALERTAAGLTLEAHLVGRGLARAAAPDSSKEI
jgi:SAM-dependent methyltransferase